MKRDLTRREFLEASGVGAAVLLGIGACEGNAPGPGVPGDASGRQRRHGRKPAASAAAAVG